MSTDIVCGKCGQRYTLGQDSAETVMAHMSWCGGKPEDSDA